MSEKKKFDFSKLFNYAFGCVGSLGVIATIIAVFISLKNPDVIIQVLESRVSNSTPMVIDISNETIVATPNEMPTVTNEPVTELSDKVLFSDNFDNGLKKDWTVIEGTPFFKNGQLGAVDEYVIIEIGDDYLQNFVLELDYSDVSYRQGLKITFSDIYYWMDNDDLSWYVYEEKEWKRFYTDGYSPGSVEGHLKIIVTGNNYSILRNSEPFIEIRQGDPHSGPIRIKVYEGAYIDNVMIFAP